MKCPEQLVLLHNGLLFLPEKMKINKQEKLIFNLNNKERHVVHKRNLQEALNHWLDLTKVDRVTISNQKERLQPYIELSINLRKNTKNGKMVLKSYLIMKWQMIMK